MKEHPHVFITGAARRLGRAIAEAFLLDGANVSAHYGKSKSEASALSNSYPGKVKLFQADLSDTALLNKLASDVAAGFGPVDIFIQSASEFFPTRLGQVTEEEWDRLLNINAKAPFFLAQAILPFLAKPSVIINLIDIHAEKPLRNFIPYTAAKAAWKNLSKGLALSLAPNTRVCSISPGLAMAPENFSAAQIQAQVDKIPLGRSGTANDIAEAARFLARSNYMTGFDLVVDGGIILTSAFAH